MFEIVACYHFQLTECDDACGRKCYTIAFIIADKENEPAWDGRFPLEEGPTSSSTLSVTLSFT